MTLGTILASALSQLDKTPDAHTLSLWRTKLTAFANDAADDLALSLRPVRVENYNLDGSIIDTATLERRCLRIVDVKKNGQSVQFSQSDASGIVSARASGQVQVCYRYLPKLMHASSDVPELPNFSHGLIVSYIVGRERMSGDVSTQAGANVYLNMYELGKQRLADLQSGTDAFRIVNRF